MPDYDTKSIPILDDIIEIRSAEKKTDTIATIERPTTLETIVEDVVKHLIPDLEQQLRFLVQQALEEKLPEKVIRRISSKHGT